MDFSAVQKAEGEIELALRAHHKYDDDTTEPIYTIEDVDDMDLEVL